MLKLVRINNTPLHLKAIEFSCLLLLSVRQFSLFLLFCLQRCNINWFTILFADLLYKSNINAGSVLEYSLAFTSAVLDKYCIKWSVAPKTGFVDITTSKDFYRIYSGLQMVRDGCSFGDFFPSTCQHISSFLTFLFR